MAHTEEEARWPEFVFGEEEVGWLPEVVPGKEKASWPIGTSKGSGRAAEEVLPLSHYKILPGFSKHFPQDVWRGP